ncbi:MAG TPA: presqualene diphosphate synthase HpnD [Dehalococcoidia bacterium]|nr:presqualene diphosphate synthase HpnD [Dehalococcoidia bacterium]
MRRNGLDVAYDICREITKRASSSFYYGFLMLPPAQRRAIYAAYAFARQCDDIVDGDLAQAEAERQLDAMRASLDRCLAGHPEGPVMKALSETVRIYKIPSEYLYMLIDGVRIDLTKRRYSTFDELREYCYGVASTTGLICIEIFGYKGGEKTRKYAEDLGIALQLTNIMRDVAEDAERGRIYIPQEELEWFGYEEADLAAGRTGPEFRRLMAYQAHRARDYYDSGRKLLDRLPLRARACVSVMSGIYTSILDEIERSPSVVYRRRVGPGTGQKLALAGREVVRSVVG